MEIKKENALAAYNAADENTKKVLLSLLPELKEAIKPKDITERVKTFEDACRELGNSHPLVLHYRANFNADGCWTDKVHASDFEAFLKLRIVCAALNEGGNRSLQKTSGVGILGSRYGQKKNCQERVTSGKLIDTSY